LEWNRVDLARKVAWLDHGATKSGEGRGIPLNSDAIAALQSTLGQHPRWCFTFGGKRIQRVAALGQGAPVRRHRGLPLPRPQTHMGKLACAKRYLVTGINGARRL
jgi:integrase